MASHLQTTLTELRERFHEAKDGTIRCRHGIDGNEHPQFAEVKSFITSRYKDLEEKTAIQLQKEYERGTKTIDMERQKKVIAKARNDTLDEVEKAIQKSFAWVDSEIDSHSVLRNEGTKDRIKMIVRAFAADVVQTLRNQ